MPRDLRGSGWGGGGGGAGTGGTILKSMRGDYRV